MYKSHIEIAKLFRYDPDTNEYFYHHKTSFTIGSKTIREDEWVGVSEDVFRFLRRSAWAEDKQQDRKSRCLKENGTRCMENCKNCENSRNGRPLSLDQLIENGLLPKAALNIEEHAEHRELLAALCQAISELEKRDQNIITLWSHGLSEREIADIVGMSQCGVGYRKKVGFKKLKEALKDFR